MNHFDSCSLRRNDVCGTSLAAAPLTSFSSFYFSPVYSYFRDFFSNFLCVFSSYFFHVLCSYLFRYSEVNGEGFPVHALSVEGRFESVTPASYLPRRENISVGYFIAFKPISIHPYI